MQNARCVAVIVALQLSVLSPMLALAAETEVITEAETESPTEAFILNQIDWPISVNTFIELTGYDKSNPDKYFKKDSTYKIIGDTLLGTEVDETFYFDDDSLNFRRRRSQEMDRHFMRNIATLYLRSRIYMENLLFQS